jgi:hypothetical protein
MKNWLSIGVLGSIVCFAASASAADPWVERPLTLGTGKANIEAGMGLGNFVSPSGTKVGGGSNLEAAIGLPFFGELRVRSGFRFAHTPDPNSKDANYQLAQNNTDYYARLFDHETANMGYGDWANPEISLHGSIVDAEVAAVGLETRVVIPIDSTSTWSVSPGLPLRFRIPKVARIDTGIFAPISVDNGTDYIISVPAQLWFQVDKAFFGPMSGFRYNHYSNFAAVAFGRTRTDVTAGLGGGYTFVERIDVKAQVYVARINDSDWSKTLGAGLGVGFTIP